MKDITPYNPLSKENLGTSVADALLTSEYERLKNVQKFNGAGIYAIYYDGDFPAYDALVTLEKAGLRIPIYVGKAVPPGARKGNVGVDNDPKFALHKRLREHSASIKDATNLELDNFYCQYLVVEDIWIPLGESLLITKYAPIWNKIVDGFGNHAPGSGRQEQAKSRWDMLHPGRGWAKSLRDRPEKLDIIKNEIVNHLRTFE